MPGQQVKTAPERDDIEPVAHETTDRIVTGSAVVIPFLLLGVAAWQAWGGALRITDVVLFMTFYVTTALGVTVGFHRHLTHRSFKTTRGVRVTLALLGSAAVEGPVISWCADHRKHHAFSDKEGDPHSPHVGHDGGWRGTLAGLFHAHVGWMFVHDQRGKRSRYTPDLLEDPALRFIDRTFLVWVVAGLVLPFVLGYAIGGTLTAGLTGLLWGGVIRMFVLHHVTFSINSLCHTFGRRRFATGRPVAEPRLARAAVDGRGLAQQPSRVPDVLPARAARVGDRSLRARDPSAGGDAPGLGRHGHHARPPGAPLRRRGGVVNRTLVSYGGAIAAGGVLIGICVAQGDKFTAALGAAPLWVLGIAVALQILALGVRTEAWHVCVCAAGGTVPRRRLYRAAGVGYVVMAVNGHLAVAARIAALRRSAPRDSPRVPALISAEVPILSLEAVLAAIFSFTLVGPLDLPWWLPLAAFAVTASLTAGLYALARRRRRPVQRARGPAQPRRPPARHLAGARGRRRADRPQLADAALHRHPRLPAGLDRGADRDRHADATARRAERRRGRDRAHPRRPWRRGGRRRGRAAHGHRDRRRAVVRRLGAGGPDLGIAARAGNHVLG